MSISFRDLLHEKYKSSTKAKKLRRRGKDTRTNAIENKVSSTALKLGRLAQDISPQGPGMNKIARGTKIALDARMEPTSNCIEYDVTVMKGKSTCASERMSVNNNSKYTESKAAHGEVFPYRSSSLLESNIHFTKKVSVDNRREERRPSLVESGVRLDELHSSLPTGAALSGTFSDSKELNKHLESDDEDEVIVASV